MLSQVLNTGRFWPKYERFRSSCRASWSFDSVASSAVKLDSASARLDLACESLISASTASRFMSIWLARTLAPSRTSTVETSVPMRALNVWVSGFSTVPNPLKTGDTVSGCITLVDIRQVVAGASRTAGVGLDLVSNQNPDIPALKMARPSRNDLN